MTQLYFSNVDANNAIDDSNNIFTDAGFTMPYGNVPQPGDDLDCGGSNVVILSGTLNFRNLQSCSSLTINSGGLNLSGSSSAQITVGVRGFTAGFIGAGTYSGQIYLEYTSSISGGTFNGAVNMRESSGISGGTFTSSVTGDSGGTAGSHTITGGTFSGVTVDWCNYFTVTGGTFGSFFVNSSITAQVTVNTSPIFNGSFDMVNAGSGSTVSGGTFNSTFACNSNTSINGGSFNGNANVGNANISSGVFGAITLTLGGSGGISGGTFNNTTMTLGTTSVTGGTYYSTGTVAFTSYITSIVGHTGTATFSAGSAPGNPGFGVSPYGGTFNQVVTVTGIPIQTDILGTGLL